MKVQRAILILALALLKAASMRAVDPATHLSQYGHTAWRVQDGIFSGAPNVITQTVDGYIWVGTENGLFRFNGDRFVLWTPPPQKDKPTSSNILSLYGAHDGSLWIGTSLGLARLKDGVFTPVSGFLGVANSLAEDRNGKIWLAGSRVETLKPLCEISGVTAECHGSGDGFPHPYAENVAVDAAGSVWVGSTDTLVHWTHGVASKYSFSGLSSTQSLAGVSAIAGAPDGSLYVGLAIAGRGLGLERVKNAVVRPLMVPGFDGSSLRVAALLVDQTGTLWVGTQEQGIYRVHGNEVEHYDSKVGLSGDSVRSIFEDHEGDVWVTTAKGVDCFRDLKVLSWSKQEGLSTDDVNSAVAGRDGSVWVGTENALDVLRNGRVSSVGAKEDLPGSRVTSILEDHLGRLWVGVDDKLAIYTEGKFKLLHRPGGRPIGTTFALAEDADGDIWASAIGGHGSDLLRIRDSEVLEVIPSTVIPRSFPLAADAHSGVWLGLSSGDIGLYRSGHFQLVPTGIKGSPILNLAVDTDGSVLGSTRVGVVGWKDGKARMLNSANGLPCDSVTSLIVSDRHSLLLRASCGMIQIDEEQLRKWWMNPKVQVTYRLFDNFDGARASGTSFQPRVSKAPDGKIWFANESELQMFDPAHAPENQIVPPVHIEEVIADRKTYASTNDISLPPLTRELEIRYAGLSFKVPQKVRFRYRLEGRDTNWQEPGGRREAFYQDLRPGHYRFRVIACNDDGIWNETGATQDFSIAPTWYQTRWFLILSSACSLLLLWTIYLLRVRYIAKAIGERFDERLAERTRIARDLHDTLLQTIQGSKLVADSALKSSSDFSRMRGSMEQLSAWLGRATEEGRAALNSLRTSATERNDLAAAFRRAMDECHMQSSMEASFSVVGEPTEMHPIVRDEVYRIGYEAIRNACVHSHAARIQVELTYADDLVLCVSDDGRGIDPAIAVQGKEGHFGLQGMRERAARIMARLTVESPPGTKITLIVPGGIIYRGTMSGRRTLRTKIESLLAQIGLRSNPPAH